METGAKNGISQKRRQEGDSAYFGVLLCHNFNVKWERLACEYARENLWSELKVFCSSHLKVENQIFLEQKLKKKNVAGNNFFVSGQFFLYGCYLAVSYLKSFQI